MKGVILSHCSLKNTAFTDGHTRNIGYRKTAALCATTACNGRERGIRPQTKGEAAIKILPPRKTGAGQRRGAYRGGIVPAEIGRREPSSVA